MFERVVGIFVSFQIVGVSNFSPVSIPRQAITCFSLLPYPGKDVLLTLFCCFLFDWTCLSSHKSKKGLLE
jgi:hypothetical protein